MIFNQTPVRAALLPFFLMALTGSVQAQSARDWPAYNGSLRGDRFSALWQINTATVKRLRPVAVFNTGESVSFQTGPVVINGTLFFTTYQTTYAIDAASGRLKWKRTHAVPKKYAGLGAARGLAYEDGLVFRGFNDGQFVALNAKNGSLLWDKVIASGAKGESLPMAPIAFGGSVFVGNAGGDNFGVTGRIYALDAKTGVPRWMFDTVPKTGPAAATWTQRSAANPQTGGALWTSFSLDPATGVLYVPTGNSAPDFQEALHPGKDLYSNCILALDARSGTLLGYVQPFKNDFHDWDMAAAPVVVRTRGGRPLVLAGGKNGLLYGIDRRKIIEAASGQNAGSQNLDGSVFGADGPSAFSIVYQTPFTRRLHTFVPLNDQSFTRFAPGTQGGMEWNGPAYDPDLNLVYTPATDWPTSIKLAPPPNLKGQTGKPWTGAYDKGFGHQDPKSRWGGYLTAIDADTGKIRWQRRTPTPLIGAVTPTAGGLVFCGDLNGQFSAFDARSGRLLWSDSTGQPIGGGVVSYQVGGRQFVAVAAAMKGHLWPVQAGAARIIIYALRPAFSH